MFFSAKEYHDYLVRNRDTSWAHLAGHAPHRWGQPTTPLTFELAAKALRTAKKAIVSRNMEAGNGVFYKWLRPWDVVPALSDFAPPVGDFGVGVEVEMGFNTLAASRTVAKKIANWKYVALDFEGGRHPIEATFPPVLYSKLSRKRTQCLRYLDYLHSVPELVVNHSRNSSVGTHINVSMGGVNFANYGGTHAQRVAAMSELLEYMCRRNSLDVVRYFGRMPYGYCYSQAGGTHGMNSWIEYKLFNSQTDSARLRQYIDIAVELTKLAGGEEEMNTSNIHMALERGYAKSVPVVRGKKAAANVSEAAVAVTRAALAA